MLEGNEPMNDATEEWRACPGVANVEVSSLGRVRRTSDCYVYVGETDKDGYQRVSVRRKHFLVHRLVYLTWHGPLLAGLVVCHMDGTRDNNRPGNLRQLTQRENIAHKITHGTEQIGERHGMSKLSDSECRSIRAAYGALPRYPRSGKVYQGALANLAAERGVRVGFILDMLRSKRP